MEGFLNITLAEIICIFLLAFLLLGPRDMLKFGRWIAKVLRKIMQSEAWGEIMLAAENMRKIPTALVNDATSEEDLQSIFEEINPPDLTSLKPLVADKKDNSERGKP